MTAPLVPANLDLRGMPFMPLDVLRLRDSDIARVSSGDAFRAAVLLWCVAWHQVPASSLPSDDAALANYAGFGRDIKAWLKVKSNALHGFELCDDGRLYHAVIAEKAIETEAKRQSYRERTRRATETKRQRNEQRNVGRNDGTNDQRNDDRNVADAPETTGDKVSKGKLSKQEREDTADAVPSSATAYAFESGIIRLTEKDFRKWEVAFPRLDLRAELTGLSEWANQQEDRWFFALSGALAKRNREVKIIIEKPADAPKQHWRSGIEGVV